MRAQVVATQQGVALVEAAGNANVDVRSPLAGRLRERTLGELDVGKVGPRRSVIGRPFLQDESGLGQQGFGPTVQVGHGDLDVDNVLGRQVGHGR